MNDSQSLSEFLSSVKRSWMDESPVEQGVLGPPEELESENRPNRLNGVHKADLLPLVIVAAVVGDGDLVHLDLHLRDLLGQFRLNREPARLNGDFLNDLPTEGFVATLHVGEIQIRADVRKQGQHPISQIMEKQMLEPDLVFGLVKEMKEIQVNHLQDHKQIIELNY